MIDQDWSASHADASLTEPGLCAERLAALDRTVRRRNLLEYAAGTLVGTLSAAGAIACSLYGLWDFAIAMTLVVAGVAIVMVTLYRSGSSLDRHPESSCRAHLHAQLDRQRKLLRRVPLWYIAPLLPGVLAIYGATATRVAENQGWAVALGGLWAPLGGTLAFFGFIIWLNLATAKGIDRQIAELGTA